MKKTLLSILLNGCMICSAHANEQDQAKLDLLYKSANKVSDSSEKSNEARGVFKEQSKQTLLAGVNALANSDLLKERVENNDQHVAQFSVLFLQQQLELKEVLLEEAEKELLAAKCKSSDSCQLLREYIAQTNTHITNLNSSISKYSVKE